MTFELREAFERLTYDTFRNSKPFSEDIEFVHRNIFEPSNLKTFVRKEDISEALRLWIQGKGEGITQPCIFGTIASAQNEFTNSQLHFCIITHDDILKLSDDEIAAMIRTEILNWKRRSVMINAQASTPAHGFVLAVISPKISRAAPDGNLKAFAEKILALWGRSKSSSNPSGEVYSESIYLRNPLDNSYYKFTFSIDYFQAQGDGRWYHDHRIPGGLAFTANSIGHMRRYREWYRSLKDQDSWTVKRAMQTIHSASNTEWGPATWLKELSENGEPYVKELKCPFDSSNDKEKMYLDGKDWTKYNGHIHSDHSIRPEFFFDEPEIPDNVKRNIYINDFTYLYNKKEFDFVKFVLGEVVSEDEVFQDIGKPDKWQTIVGPRKMFKRTRVAAKKEISESKSKLVIKEFLKECERKWRISNKTFREIDE